MSCSRFVSLSVFFVVCAMSGHAWARIADTTRSLRAGQLSLAGQFVANVQDDTPLDLNFHEEVGLRSGLDLTLDQTIRVSEGDGFLFGAGVKWTLLNNSRKSPGLALWLTGFYDSGPDDAGFRSFFMIDNTWSKFTPYLALNFDLLFADDAEPSFTVIGGTRLALVKNVDAYFEGGFNVDDTPDTDFLSAGIRVAL